MVIIGKSTNFLKLILLNSYLASVIRRLTFHLAFLFPILISCKPKKGMQIRSVLQETGAIQNPRLVGANFSQDYARLGVFKLCTFKTLTRCQSSSLLGRRGELLTTAHGIGLELQTSEDHDLDVEMSKFVTNDLMVVSPFDRDALGRPVEPEVFRADLLISNPHSEQSSVFDILLFRVRDLNRLQLWSHPFNVDLIVKTNDYERYFLVGFPWPHLSQRQLYQASLEAANNETVFPKGYNDEKEYFPGVERLPFNFDFTVSTGVGKVTPEGDFSSETESYPKRMDVANLPSYIGNSGGAILNRSGEYVAMVNSGAHSGNIVGKGDLRPIGPTWSSNGLLMKEIYNFYKLDRLKLLDSEKSKEDLIRKNKLDDINRALKEKANSLEEYLGQVFQLFKNGRRLKSTYDTSTDIVICRTLGEGLEGESIYKSNNVRISKIQVELISAEKSRIRYYAPLRDNKKIFELWKYGSSGWSPWFEFHTARLLAETRISSIADISVDGIKLKAFAPFLYDDKNIKKFWPDYLDGRIKQEFRYHSHLLEAVIGGVYPKKEKDGRSLDNWTPILCK